MYLKSKYQKIKLEVDRAEKKRNVFRNNESWLEIRNLKKIKLVLKDAMIKETN